MKMRKLERDIYRWVGSQSLRLSSQMRKRREGGWDENVEVREIHRWVVSQFLRLSSQVSKRRESEEEMKMRK